MAETISLRCRIAALETELRLVKEQLAQSQSSTACLVSILGRQPQLAVQGRPDQELHTIRAQLDDTLQCNARLERLLAATRRARSTLETREETQIAMIEGECSEDLLAWSASEIGVRDGWATTEEKSGETVVSLVVEPAIDDVQVVCSEEKIGEMSVPVVIEPATHDDQIAYPEEKKDEVGTARPVHMRSYSREEVNHYDIQPAASLQYSLWAGPPSGPRWPTPQPRPYARRPYNSGYTMPSYEVTNSIHSKDPSLRRTVLVTKIPIGMLLSEVLDHLKSDRILVASFAGTAGMKTSPPVESNAAIVEFLDSEDAQMYVDTYAKDKMFEVMLVATPTRPLRRSRVDPGFN